MAVLLLSLAAGGCKGTMTCPRVIYLDGAGWHSGDGPVRKGLLGAGFAGAVERYDWQGLFGPLPDHLWANEHHGSVPALARRVTKLRRANPEGRIVLMGLSAGTGLVVAALEKLPEDILVDDVVLLSPSVSAWHDLTQALRHVRRRLYATHSRYDGLLSTSGSAGGKRGPPAGRRGFRLPEEMPLEKQVLYRKLIHLPWRPEYAAYGWDGGHVSVTSRDFIRVVIAPRILGEEPHPLDRPIAFAEGSER